MLEAVGYDVDEAADGGQVLEHLKGQRPDLILLDLQMPVMGGFEVVRKMRSNEEYESIPVIALTASAMQGDRERALEMGFTGYLTKPIRLEELRKELGRLLTK